MRIVDRHIAFRFLWNFATLFALLFVFAISIDVIVQLDQFLEAADTAVAKGMYGGRATALASLIFSFHGPRVFQFYAYLLGLLCVGAMGFTLAQMHRHREFLALLASGVSLQRVGAPILAAAALLNALQLVNTEIVIPRLAPLLLRERDQMLESSSANRAVPLMPDGRGRLIMASAFDPAEETLRDLLVLERDANGTALRRIAAPSARWDGAVRAWRLEGGVATPFAPRPTGASGAGAATGVEGAATNPVAATGAVAKNTPSRLEIERTPVELIETDLDPRTLRIRHSALFAQMLSLRELAEVEADGAVDPGVIGAARWGRFAGIASNFLVLLLALPSFLLREPAKLLSKSIECAGFAIGAMLLVLVGLTVHLPGVPAGLTVFLPVMMVAPIAVARYWAVRT